MANNSDVHSSHIDTKIIKQRVPVLQRYINNNPHLELHALYAAQAFNHSLHNPPGLLRILFCVLYEKDVCSEESFYDWKVRQKKAITSQKNPGKDTEYIHEPEVLKESARSREIVLDVSTMSSEETTQPEEDTRITEKTDDAQSDVVKRRNEKESVVVVSKKKAEIAVVPDTTPAKQEPKEKKSTEDREDGNEANNVESKNSKSKNGTKKSQKNKMQLKYSYREDQWSPVNPEGKKQYDRDFLLQFQKECMVKPDGLPNIPDIVLDRAIVQPLSLNIPQGGNQKRPDFMPHFMKSRGVQNNWVPRRQESKPTTIDALHKEWHIAEAKSYNGPSRSREQAPPPCTVTPQADDGWNTVPTTNKTRTAYHPSKLKLARMTADDNIPLGPGGRGFSTWGRGSIGASNKNQSPSDSVASSQEDAAPPQANRLSMLSEDDNRPVSRGGSGSYGSRDRDSRGGRGQAVSIKRPSREREKEAAIEEVQRISRGRPSRPEQPDPRGSQEKVAPRVEKREEPTMTDAKVKQTSKATVDEYLNLRDFNEASRCVSELPSKQRHLFVQTTVDHILEKKQDMRETVGVLFQSLININLLSKEQYLTGMKDVIEFADDMAIDIPKIYEYLGEIMGAMVVGGAEYLQLQATAVKPLLKYEKAGVLMAEVLRTASRRNGASKVSHIWQQAGLKWENFLPEGENVQEFVQKKLGPGGRGFSTWGRGSIGASNKNQSPSDSAAPSQEDAASPQANRFSMLSEDLKRPVRGGSGSYGSRDRDSRGGRSQAVSISKRLTGEREKEASIAEAQRIGRGRPSRPEQPEPRGSQEKVAPKVEKREEPTMTDAKVKQTSKATVDKYLNLRDFNEASRCVSELPSKQRHLFVQTTVDHILEKKQDMRETVGVLFQSLININLLTKEQYLTGMKDVIEFADDMAVDIPKIYEYLGEIMGAMVFGGAEYLQLQATAVKPLLEFEKAGVLLAEVLRTASRRNGASKVSHIWQQAGLKWENFLPEGENVQEFVQKKDPIQNQDNPVKEGKPNPEDQKIELKYAYREDQWSLVNPEGKKQYDRDFLLQFQKGCTDKPDGLPNIPDIILDRLRQMPQPVYPVRHQNPTQIQGIQQHPQAGGPAAQQGANMAQIMQSNAAAAASGQYMQQGQPQYIMTGPRAMPIVQPHCVRRARYPQQRPEDIGPRPQRFIPQQAPRPQHPVPSQHCVRTARYPQQRPEDIVPRPQRFIPQQGGKKPNYPTVQGRRSSREHLNLRDSVETKQQTSDLGKPGCKHGPEKTKGVEFTLDGASAADNGLNSVCPQGDWLQVFNRGLTELLNKRPDNDKIFDWIEHNVAETQKKNPEFIRALVTIICQNAAEGKGQGCRIDPEILKQRGPVLQRYIDNKRPLELHALHAVQALNHSNHNPPGLLRILFDFLYDEDVVIEESFYDWKANDDPKESAGKAMALKSVKSFFTWLAEAY